MNLTGLSLIGSQRAAPGESTFNAINPATGEVMQPAYHSASAGETDAACQLAAEAFPDFASVPGKERAVFLRRCADKIDALVEELADIAPRETGLPEGRIRGETARTTAQLRLFASLVEEGSWCQPRIDHADPSRKPLPKPDVRSMLVPMGPVAVFGASNFPLAFSVAGGDTASALAAGCPVVVKAHGSHPGTAELVGLAIREAVNECDLPEGVFSLLYGPGREIGAALVAHPAITAVGFTGSRAGGTALMRIAASRDVPIPVYAEMSSINPVVILPGALPHRSDAIAAGLAASVTLGMGQFCTNPGLVLLDAGEEADALVAAISREMGNFPGGVMLNQGICGAYTEGVARLGRAEGVRCLAGGEPSPGPGCRATGAVFEVDGATFLSNPRLTEEVFGPATLLVRTAGTGQMVQIISSLEGQLTGTLHGDPDSIAACSGVVAALRNRVGRLIFNGFPTGVEVCHSMVHGGPFPATSDGRSTSVGTLAIERFCRFAAWQDWPDAALPPELRDANPFGIRRRVDNRWE